MEQTIKNLEQIIKNLKEVVNKTAELVISHSSTGSTFINQLREDYESDSKMLDIIQSERLDLLQKIKNFDVNNQNNINLPNLILMLHANELRRRNLEEPSFSKMEYQKLLLDRFTCN